LAAAGVAYLTIDYGRLPWIALVLAFTFALYGAVKKSAPLGAVDGLALETGLLSLPAFAMLAVAETSGQGHLLGAGPTTAALLVGTGVVTTVPLLLFSSAARHIPLSLIGVLQYITPTLQFLLGVFVFGEAMTAHTLVGFVAVWAALALFAGDAIMRRVAQPVAAE
jgi:chloramphenicol-sensitive protein RarD